MSATPAGSGFEYKPISGPSQMIVSDQSDGAKNVGEITNVSLLSDGTSLVLKTIIELLASDPTGSTGNAVAAVNAYAGISALSGGDIGGIIGGGSGGVGT